MSSTTTVGPETINALADAVYPAMAMLAGMKLDLFTPLRNGLLTTEEIAGELGLPPRQLGQLLYALVDAGLMTVTDGRFSNCDEAARFLVKGAQDYYGSRHLNFSLKWSALLKTADSVISDGPQARLDFSAMSAGELEDFYSGSYVTALSAGKGLAARYDFSSCRNLVDVAGGSGGLSVGITESYPNIQATVVDFPSTVPITRQYVQAAGASHRVGAQAGNVVESTFLGSYDVAILSNFIQVLSEDQARDALRHVFVSV